MVCIHVFAFCFCPVLLSFPIVCVICDIYGLVYTTQCACSFSCLQEIYLSARVVFDAQFCLTSQCPTQNKRKTTKQKHCSSKCESFLLLLGGDVLLSFEPQYALRETGTLGKTRGRCRKWEAILVLQLIITGGRFTKQCSTG